MTAAPKTLLLAWGNPGRGDDGLGPAVARWAAEESREGLTVESDYQLQIEDAAEVARHDRVVFVDADRAGPGPFSCSRVRPAQSGLGFTSHSVSPAALLALSRQLFGHAPEAWLVAIRGYDFDRFDESLSSGARANLAEATRFLDAALPNGSLDESWPETDEKEVR